MPENLHLKKKHAIDAAKEKLITATYLLLDPTTRNMSQAAFMIMMSLLDIRDADHDQKAYQTIVDHLQKIKNNNPAPTH